MKLFKIQNNYFFTWLLVTIVLLAIQPFLEIAVAFTFFLLFFLLMKNKKEFVFIFVIISSLVLTTTISPILRLIIQILNYSLLSFVFLKQYQFQIQEYPRPPLVIVGYLLVLLSLMVVSSVHSSQVFLGFSQIGRTILFFFLIYLLYALINSESEIKVYLAGLFLVALIYLTFLIYELARFDFDILTLNLNGFDESGSAYVHKNALGSFFVMTILLLMSFSFNKDYSHIRKWFFILISFFMCGLVITNARGAIIALFVGIIYLIYSLNIKDLKYLVGILLSIGFLFFLLPFQEYIDLYFRFEKISTGRDYILSTFWNVIQNNWLFGSGPAASRFEMYKNIPYLLGSSAELFLRHHFSQIEFGHAHSFYLFFFSDLGILGFLLSLALPFLFLKIAFQTISILQKEKKELYYLSVGITAFGISMFVRAIFEWGGLISYGTIGFDLPFWLLFAIIIFINKKVIHSHDSLSSRLL
ncbi:MAG: O-antigen ligase family protein [Ignavibacteriaceae bacterium]|nr:O-antigen ligase family protein [Ignavibacteriaceae bacterium]